MSIVICSVVTVGCLSTVAFVGHDSVSFASVRPDSVNSASVGFGYVGSTYADPNSVGPNVVST